MQLLPTDKMKWHAIITWIRVCLWWGMEHIKSNVVPGIHPVEQRIPAQTIPWPDCRWGVSYSEHPYLLQYENRQMTVFQFYPLKMN